MKSSASESFDRELQNGNKIILKSWFTFFLFHHKVRFCRKKTRKTTFTTKIPKKITFVNNYFRFIE